MDKIEKFLRSLSKNDRSTLALIMSDIKALRLKKYDIKPLSGYKNFYRLRKGKIRIVFFRNQGKGLLIDITFRKDAYKNI